MKHGIVLLLKDFKLNVQKWLLSFIDDPNLDTFDKSSSRKAAIKKEVHLTYILTLNLAKIELGRDNIPFQ
jgi:hypothetical protein